MAAAIPVIIAAVGTYAQMQSTEEANKERRNILNAQLDRDDATSKKSNQLVLDQAQKFDPNARQQSLVDAEKEVSTQQQKDLEAGAGGGEVGAVQTSGGAGNVSDDFLTAKAERAVTEGNRLTNIARQMAKTRSTGRLLENEGYGQANLAGELANIGSANQNFARAAGADAGNVQEGSLGTYGKIASSIGSSAAGNYINGVKYPASKAPSASSGIQWGA